MDYIVGMDLRDSRSGVVRFADWLRARGGCDRLVGVHVVEGEEPSGSDDELVRKAELALGEWVAGLGVAAAFDELLVVRGHHIDEALRRVCSERKNAGLIIGRRVGQDEQGWTRLGSTTRRLLRTLPVPVIVVPPDIDLATLGAGPVLVAITTAEEASWAAFQFGSEVAHNMQRKVELVSVVPEQGSPVYLPPAIYAEQEERKRVQAERHIAQWLAGHGIEATTHVVSGPLLESLLAQVKEKGAPLVVCGRNKATVVQRFLGGTAATELATFSRVPVVVVAPPLDGN